MTDELELDSNLNIPRNIIDQLVSDFKDAESRRKKESLTFNTKQIN